MGATRETMFAERDGSLGTDRSDALDTPTLKRLADIAGSAFALGMVRDAETIYTAIRPFCSPGSTGLLTGLAMTTFFNGKPDESIALLREEALPMDPECPHVLTHLAVLLSSTGEHDEALDCVRRAAAAGPPDEELRALMDRVSEGKFVRAEHR